MQAHLRLLKSVVGAHRVSVLVARGARQARRSASGSGASDRGEELRAATSRLWIASTFILGLCACGTVMHVADKLENAVRLSKQGSREEEESLRKAEATSRAVARGSTTGVIDVTGKPRSYVTHPFLQEPDDKKKR